MSRGEALRFNVVFGLLMLAVPALCVRVGLAISEHSHRAQELAERQQRTVRVLPARLGSIYCRSSQSLVPLAVSRQVPSAFADPLDASRRRTRHRDLAALEGSDRLEAIARRVAPVLDVSAEGLGELLVARGDSRFVWLGREISERQADAIRAMNLPGVGIQQEYRRVYPSGSLAGSVVGFRMADGLPGGGLELVLDPYLQASEGRLVARADARGRQIMAMPEASSMPQDGMNVVLCLDAVIQASLQKALDAAVEKYQAEWGVGVVMDPHTGAVLAMHSSPSFDPNEFNRTPSERRTNHVISSPFEPGSVFKPIIAAAAVDAGIVSWDTRFNTGGGTYYFPRGGRISDHGKAFGTISAAVGIIQSSNILMGLIGLQVGNAQLHEIVTRFGFGQRTFVELPGESPGIVRPLARWNTYSTPRVPIGQEISVTALQLTTAFAALANGGVLMRPRLVDYITDAQGNVAWRSAPHAVRRVVSPQSSAQVLEVMRLAVEEGTGKSARSKRWSIWGKTGTAQVPVDGAYNRSDYAGSFVGGAPADRPRLVCLITIYRPQRSLGYYGGTVAAPYVKQVLEESLEYLGVPPDLSPDRRVLMAATASD